MLSLERFKQPMLHKVLYIYHRLLEHLQPTSLTDGARSSSRRLIAFKCVRKPILLTKFVVVIIYVEAALLDSMTKRRLVGWASSRT